jgi:hypothetical protein
MCLVYILIVSFALILCRHRVDPYWGDVSHFGSSNADSHHQISSTSDDLLVTTLLSSSSSSGMFLSFILL